MFGDDIVAHIGAGFTQEMFFVGFEPTGVADEVGNKSSIGTDGDFDLQAFEIVAKAVGFENGEWNRGAR